MALFVYSLFFVWKSQHSCKIYIFYILNLGIVSKIGDCVAQDCVSFLGWFHFSVSGFRDTENTENKTKYNHDIHCEWDSIKEVKK